MYNKQNLELRASKKQAEMFLKDYKHNLLQNGKLLEFKDLYISPHFIDRVAERRLVGDLPFIVNLLSYFLHQVFYNTTQCNKNFTLKIHNLRVGVSIVDNHYVSKHRAIIVKTAFDRDEDEKGWFSNEVVEVKAVKKDNQTVYMEI